MQVLPGQQTPAKLERLMLTEQEIKKIFAWLPYKGDWPVDRNQPGDNIERYYGKLIKELTLNDSFATYYSQDGGLSNYLEFICYPEGHVAYNGNAIVVCVSLCAPIAVYGETKFVKTSTSWSWNFIEPETVGLISDRTLAYIEKEVVSVLKKHNLTLLNPEFVSSELPIEVADALKGETITRGISICTDYFKSQTSQQTSWFARIPGVVHDQ